MTAPADIGPDTEGMVFDIQHFSIHDGPGIRTTVFMKGCPLSCLWCQNPESQSAAPEVMFHAERCTGCGLCVAACANGAVSIEDGLSRTARDLCTGLGACVEACPNRARTLTGRRMRAGDVFERVAADAMFYERSGGGVTLSGGEPLAQPDFAEALLRLCKDAGLHTAVDTCGYAGWRTVARVLRYADLVLYDLKHMDSAEHERLTGVSNAPILENARRIRHELHLPIHARIPLVPGWNDDLANLEATARFIAEELGLDTPVHLHPYHRFGEGKYESLGRIAATPPTPPADDEVERAKQVFAEFGLHVVIGG